jgi:hypothetical protein
MSNQTVPHGVPGQVNIFTLDKNSSITSFGKHNRLLVFGEVNGNVSIREDLNTGPKLSNWEDRAKVASDSYQRMHPEGTWLKPHLEQHEADCIWFEYLVIPSKGSK